MTTLKALIYFDRVPDVVDVYDGRDGNPSKSVTGYHWVRWQGRWRRLCPSPKYQGEGLHYIRDKCSPNGGRLKVVITSLL